ncbi:glutamine ABC transporter substrate-binding protein [Nocardioides sp. AN3]
MLAACGSSDDQTAVSADCHPADHLSPLHPGALTVAVYEAPPYITFKGNDLGGADGDILEKFAATECLSIKAAPAAAAAVIPSVQDGRADVAAGGWWRSAARAKVLALTNPIYTDQMVFISADGLKKVSDLKGKRVGTVNGNVWVDDVKAYLGDGLKLYRAPTDLYQDLRLGRLDVGIDGFGEAKSNSNGLKVEVVEPDPAVAASLEPPQTGFPISKDNQTLVDALNAYIAKIKADGTLKSILVKNDWPANAGDTGSPRLIS